MGNQLPTRRREKLTRVAPGSVPSEAFRADSMNAIRELGSTGFPDGVEAVGPSAFDGVQLNVGGGLDSDRVTFREPVSTCPRPVVLVNRATGELFNKPCRCWRCQTCGPIRYRHELAHMNTVVRALGLTSFVTLTLDPKVVLGWELMSKEDRRLVSREMVLGAWSKANRRINRLVRSGFPYYTIGEFQKSGSFHLHVLTNVKLSELQWLEIWFECGGGAVIDVQDFSGVDAVTGQDGASRVAAYVGKYLSKGRSDCDGKPLIFCSRGVGLYSNVGRAFERRVNAERLAPSLGRDVAAKARLYLEEWNRVYGENPVPDTLSEPVSSVPEPVKSEYEVVSGGRRPGESELDPGGRLSDPVERLRLAARIGLLTDLSARSVVVRIRRPSGWVRYARSFDGSEWLRSDIPPPDWSGDR